MRSVFAYWAAFLVVGALTAQSVLGSVRMVMKGVLDAVTVDSIVVTTAKGKYIIPRTAIDPTEAEAVAPERAGRMVKFHVAMDRVQAVPVKPQGAAQGPAR